MAQKVPKNDVAIVAQKLDDVWVRSSVAASTGVAHNQRQGRSRCWNFGVERVDATVNAEAHKSVANMFGGIGSGSTIKALDCLRNVRQATRRQRER